jgi:hypothetical protein
MADLRISELAALAGANLAAGDLLAIVDVSASETKKITVTDLVGNATTLIADATIPGAKILFSSGSIAGASIASGGVGATQLANDAVVASKIADEATVDLVTTLPGSGAFVGQLALDTDDLKVYCWDGSQWQSIKAAGSINSVVGTSTGLVNISIATVGDTVTISTSLDNTSAAAQFLAGPTSASGAVSYRTIAGGDLPVATSTAKGGVSINGQGLRLNGNQLEVNNDVTAEGTIYGVVQYDAKGLVTAGRAITSVDLPVATSGAIGAVLPGTGLSVDAGGVINHTNTVTPGTFTKVTVTAQGHVSGSSTLLDTDIPNLPASKLTSGTLSASLFGTNSVSGAKLGNYSTVQFGGAGSTSGVVTFPTADYTGQMFFDANNGDLYLYDGNTWQPITVISGDLVYAGTYSAATNTVASVTTQGSAAGLTIGAALPAASETNIRYYVVVSQSGVGVSPAPAVALAPPDMVISNGATWDLVDVSNAIAGQTATNISFTPYGNIAATNVQTALQELDDEKVKKAGDTITGELLIGAAGSLAFEGSTEDAYETYLAVVNPTADRTITLPDASGTVALAGTIANADIVAAAGIVDTKLATISTTGKVSNSATTATNNNVNSAIVSRDGSGNFSAGTITAALSGNASTATTAATLTTARAIQGVNFDGSAAITVVTAGSGISVTGTAVANTGVLSVNGSAGAITNVAVTDAAQSFTAQQRGTISALTDGATITPDFAVANNFSVTLGGSRTLANPSNLTAGASGCIWITQDGTGSRTLAYGSQWDFTGGTAPTLTTTAAAVDCLVYSVQSSTKITATLITNLS